MVDANIDAQRLQARRQFLAIFHGTDAVHHHAHRHAAPGSPPQRRDKALAKFIEPKDVVLEIHALTGGIDTVQQPIEESLAVGVEPGALPVAAA